MVFVGVLFEVPLDPKFAKIINRAVVWCGLQGWVQRPKSRSFGAVINREKNREDLFIEMHIYAYII